VWMVRWFGMPAVTAVGMVVVGRGQQPQHARHWLGALWQHGCCSGRLLGVDSCGRFAWGLDAVVRSVGGVKSTASYVLPV